MKKLIFLLLLLLLPISTFGVETFECIKWQWWFWFNSYFKCSEFDTPVIPEWLPYRVNLYEWNDIPLWYTGTVYSHCWNGKIAQLERKKASDMWYDTKSNEWEPYRMPIFRYWTTVEKCICPQWSSQWEDWKCRTQEEIVAIDNQKVQALKETLERQQIEAQARIQYQQNVQEELDKKASEAQRKAQEETQKIEQQKVQQDQIQTLIAQNAQLLQIIASGSQNPPVSGTWVVRVKTRIELPRERFYANQKARLEAHYARMKAIGERYRQLQK